MVAQTTPTRATLNDAFKYFIANIDFCTTAAQVEEFFCQFGNVNHVKLLPPQPGSSGSTSGGTKGEIQLHRGYGFLFMLDEESCLNVDQYVSSFPENKIMMLGRKGVHVKRQMGMGRGGHDYNNTNNGWNANNNAVSNQYHPSWAQYYGYNNMQPHVGGTPYNTSINHQNPQQMAYYTANYYTSPTTVTVGPAGQAQLYSQPAMVSSSTTPYTQPQQQQQQQYLTDANYARSVYVPQTNQVVPPQQQQQQQYQQQHQLPPHYDPYANPQMNHQQQTQPPPMQQQQQQQQQQHPLPPLPLQQQQGLGSMMNNGGRGSEGGGKWQHHQDNNRSGGGRGGGGRCSINGGGRGGGGRSGGAGRNGRDGRMDRPY